MTRPTHPACLPVEELLRDCHVERTRRSGPGGQHRNKVETAIVIEHAPTGTRAEASERRSQAENRKVAMHRLRVQLAMEIRSPLRTTDGDVPHEGESPSALWRGRCRGGKIEVNPSHDDFPALLAEALDAIFAYAYDVRQAASQLGVTTTQLVRLFQQAPTAFIQLNARREEAGLRRLR